MSPKRVVLVGAGHAHVEVLRRWGQAPMAGSELTLVADREEALYSGMVPGFVAGQYQARDLSIDARRLAHEAGAQWVLSRVTHVDPETHSIQCEDGSALSYDLASLDVGSTVAGAELPGVREHAISTRPIAGLVSSAEALLRHARSVRGHPFRLVVVGAGAGGVELACCFQQRLQREGVSPVRVQLLDAGDRLLEGAHRRLRARATRAMVSREIDFQFGAEVRAVEKGRLALASGETLAFDALVWAAGAAAHSFLSDGLPVDERGFVRVRPTFQVVGHDDLFAVGDCASFESAPLAKAGVYAVRAGPVLDANLRAGLRGEALAPYRPQRDFLTLLNLGDGSALGGKWGWTFQGRWAMRWKDRIDRRFMARYAEDSSQGR
jgi:selenide,water dikinase